MPLRDIFGVARRFSLQNRNPRTPITSPPNGTPIASPTVVAMLSGVEDFVGAFFAEDAWLLAEEEDDDIPLLAFLRSRTSVSRP
jgi:hypothetical protein